jgi:hypothetical protein
MGRESTITYEQVAAIADAMKTEGAKPTSRAVRERLGNTGSMGTINKLLGRWKAGQERQISAALVLPPALQRVLLEFMDTELTAARTALEAELADQQQEAADLAAENERQVIENDAQADTIELLRAEVSTHQGRAGQLESDLVVSRDEAARERSGAELARTELTKAQLRLEAMPRLEADLVAVRAVLEAERTARQQAKEDAAVLASKLEAAERRIADNEARSTKAEAATKAAGQQHTAELAEYKNTLQQTIAERDRHHAELLKLQAQADAAAAQHTTTLAELGIARQQASEARESAANLAGKMEAMETKIVATAPAPDLAPAHPKTKSTVAAKQ